MNRQLTDADIASWAATEARFTPAADHEEARATFSAMRMLAWVLVVTCVPVLTGAAALVRFFLELP